MNKLLEGMTMGKRQKYQKFGKLTSDKLDGHGTEKFTEMAVAYRRQVGQLLGTCTPLLRMDIATMAHIETVVTDSLNGYLDCVGVNTARDLYLMIEIAWEKRIAAVSREAWRWANVASEYDDEGMEVPEWFGLVQ